MKLFRFKYFENLNDNSKIAITINDIKSLMPIHVSNRNINIVSIFNNKEIPRASIGKSYLKVKLNGYNDNVEVYDDFFLQVSLPVLGQIEIEKLPIDEVMFPSAYFEIETTLDDILEYYDLKEKFNYKNGRFEITFEELFSYLYGLDFHINKKDFYDSSYSDDKVFRDIYEFVNIENLNNKDYKNDFKYELIKHLNRVIGDYFTIIPFRIINEDNKLYIEVLNLLDFDYDSSFENSIINMFGTCMPNYSFNIYNDLKPISDNLKAKYANSLNESKNTSKISDFISEVNSLKPLRSNDILISGIDSNSGGEVNFLTMPNSYLYLEVNNFHSQSNEYKDFLIQLEDKNIYSDINYEMHEIDFDSDIEHIYIEFETPLDDIIEYYDLSSKLKYKNGLFEVSMSDILTAIFREDKDYELDNIIEIINTINETILHDIDLEIIYENHYLYLKIDLFGGFDITNCDNIIEIIDYYRTERTFDVEILDRLVI